MRIALVTGANKGIGLEVARQLSLAGVTAIIGSRDKGRGAAAAARLAQDGITAPVVALDVTSEESVRAGVGEIESQYGRIDILVNNAAILIDGPGGFESSLFDLENDTLKLTLETNVAGPLRLIQAVAPLMRKIRYGRIVNLSSGAGQLADMQSGFPAYRMSKTALNALTRIAAAELNGTGILVNACCPGWVRTDMGGPEATRSVEEGAETPVWLSMLPDSGPTGGFFRDKQPIPW
jgi:NAD(P)-dependent dehydrogenase (short-subunit alcohol dehydrogenase family)